MGCNTSEIFEEPSPRDLAEELIENYITALSKRDYETIRQLANIPVTPLVLIHLLNHILSKKEPINSSVKILKSNPLI